MMSDVSGQQGTDGGLEQRNKIVRRLFVAGVLVAVLLGVLAFFDYLASPPEEPDDGPVFTEPVPVAPKKEVSQPVTPASELPVQVTPAAVQETPPPPQPEAQPAVPVAAPKADVVQPVRPLTVPVPPVASGHPAPQPATVVPETRMSRPVPEGTAAPSQVLPPEPTSRKPPPPVAEPPSTAVVAPGAAARLISGFLLQAGVFTSQQRAEELHAKLTLSGVPSTLETRVQVGPFKTRQEAEAARAKLRELGVDTVLVPPRPGKH